MKKTIYLLSIGLITFLAFGFNNIAKDDGDQGIQFISGDFDDALELAEEQNKPIFMDAYTDWCGWCKKLDKNAFKNKRVGKYMNEHFINVKVDMESRIGKELKQSYAVRGYPTLLFINTDEKVISRIDGYIKSNGFLSVAKEAKADFDKLQADSTDTND